MMHSLSNLKKYKEGLVFGRMPDPKED